MRFELRLISILILLILAVPVSLLKGCASEEGCPAVLTFYTSCAPYANSGDTITGPEGGDLKMTAGLGGGTVFYMPLQYVVLDSSGAPRNNVCVDFYTDGYFYADINYLTKAQAFGIGGKITLRTNDRGVICLYWSTEDLPDTAGTGDTYVTAQSGPVSHNFTVTWTVE